MKNSSKERKKIKTQLAQIKIQTLFQIEVDHRCKMTVGTLAGLAGFQSLNKNWCSGVAPMDK